MSLNEEFKPYLRVWPEDLPEDVTSWVVERDDPPSFLQFTYRETIADVGCGYITVDGEKKAWATVYDLRSTASKKLNKVQTRQMLRALKKHYEKHGYDFGSAYRKNIQHILRHNKIKERA